MRKEKGSEGDYDYLSFDVIRRACRNDKEALEKVVSRYDSYALRCLKQIAVGQFSLDTERIPLDDLLQSVWMRMIELIVTRFKIS